MAWNSAKPALNDALVSADVRGNFQAIEATFGAACLASSTSPVVMGTSPTFKPGGSATVDATAVGRIASDFATHTASSGGGETDLATATVKANTLLATGKALRVTGFGTMANNGNTQTIRFYFGVTGFIAITGIAAVANKGWYATALVIASSSSAERVGGHLNVGAAGVPVLNAGFQGTAAVALNADVTVKFTGASSAASADVTQEGMVVEVVG